MERSGRWLRVSTGRQEEGMQVPDVERWESARNYDVKRVYTVHGGSAFKGNKKFDDEWAKGHQGHQPWRYHGSGCVENRPHRPQATDLPHD